MKLLKMYADWCQPCKGLSKMMEGMELSVPVENINIDENMELASKYNVRGVPTLILVDDEGNVIRQKVGNMSKEELLKFVSG